MNKCIWSIRFCSLYLQYTEDKVLQFLYKKEGQYQTKIILKGEKK